MGNNSCPSRVNNHGYTVWGPCEYLQFDLRTARYNTCSYYLNNNYYNDYHHYINIYYYYYYHYYYYYYHYHYHYHYHYYKHNCNNYHKRQRSTHDNNKMWRIDWIWSGLSITNKIY